MSTCWLAALGGFMAGVSLTVVGIWAALVWAGVWATWEE